MVALRARTPTDDGHRSEDHARIVSELVAHLDLRDAVLVGQD